MLTQTQKKRTLELWHLGYPTIQNIADILEVGDSDVQEYLEEKEEL